MLPLTVVGFMGGNAAGAAADTDVNGVLSWLAANFSAGTWTHIISYSVLVIFFTFFYTSIMFNPEETADNLRKYGGFIPGIRPGSNTAAYFDCTLQDIEGAGQPCSSHAPGRTPPRVASPPLGLRRCAHSAAEGLACPDTSRSLRPPRPKRAHADGVS